MLRLLSRRYFVEKLNIKSVTGEILYFISNSNNEMELLNDKVTGKFCIFH